MCKLSKQLAAARNCSVPLVSIETPDPMATIERLLPVCNGSPVAMWDIIRGYQHLNTEGATVLSATGSCENNPLDAIKALGAIPPDSLVFFHMADRFYSMPPIIQAMMNLRDEFSAHGRMLVMLGANFGTMPPELKRSVLALDEPLPDQEQLAQIVDRIVNSAAADIDEFEISDEVHAKAIDSVRGLSAFEAEQVIAMSINKQGLDVAMCQDRKRKMIEGTKGLSVFNASHSFADLAGLEQVKEDLTGLMTGPLRPKAVVWLDEIEKSGLAHQHDLSGVNSDQLGTVLSYMEDNKVFGNMLVGVPGCGKSELCKAMAKEFGVLVIRVDMGEMQGSLVGESQQQLRQALKVITAICGDNALFIATSNSIEGLDSALKSRFTDTFFFDLPGEDQKRQCWDVHKKAYGIDDNDHPSDEGWSGRNIQRCCLKAYSRGVSLRKAAQFVIPEAVRSKEEIALLRTQASGKYLSADFPGAYTMPVAASSITGRKMKS